MTGPGCAAPLEPVVSTTFSAAHGILGLVQGDARLQAPDGALGTRVSGPIVWVIPVDGGVVLVDTGFDASGARLRELIGQRRVLAVLLTHGHHDHVAGVQTLGEVPVYIHPLDLALWQRPERYRAPLLLLAERVLGTPPRPSGLRLVRHGEVVEVGGTRFTALHLPGHTPGSVVWQHGDTLYSGDAVVSPNGRYLKAAYPVYCEDVRRAEISMRRLRGVAFETLCDGHYGCTREARPKLLRAIHGPRHDDDKLW